MLALRHLNHRVFIRLQVRARRVTFVLLEVYRLRSVRTALTYLQLVLAASINACRARLGLTAPLLVCPASRARVLLALIVVLLVPQSRSARRAQLVRIVRWELLRRYRVRLARIPIPLVCPSANHARRRISAITLALLFLNRALLSTTV
jgi:hypothetical protein